MHIVPSVVELKKQIISTYSAHYALNDPAHREEHFEDVYLAGLYINEVNNFGFSPKVILFCSYFQDMFAWSRKNHHELSSEFISGTDQKLIVENLTIEERTMISTACLEHRASRTLPHTTLFSQLMSAADRGIPKPILEMAKRSYAYTRAVNKGMSRLRAMTVAVDHIKDKFGSNGYARYPDCYNVAYAGALARIRKGADELTTPDLEEYLKP